MMSRAPVYTLGLLFFLTGFVLGCDSDSLDEPKETLEAGTFIATLILGETVDLSGTATFGQFTRDDTTYFALVMETEISPAYNGGSYSLSLANLRQAAPPIGRYQIGSDVKTSFFPFLGWRRTSGNSGNVSFIFPESGTLVVSESKDGALQGSFSMELQNGNPLEGTFHALLTEDLDDGDVLIHR